MDFDTGATGVRGPRYVEFRIPDPFRSFGRTVYDLIFDTRDFFRALSVPGD